MSRPLHALFALAALTHCSSDSSATPADAGTVTHPGALSDAHPADGPARADAGRDATDASALAPTDIPFTVVPDGTDGAERFIVSTQLGSSPALDVMFDTGASGLRILPGTLPDSAFDSITTTAITFSFRSGVVLDGVVATIKVALGPLATPGPIAVMLVRTVSCSAAVPDCDTVSPFDSYGAVLGVGLRVTTSAGGVGSPLSQFTGHPSFIVRAPAHGGTAGTLRFAPSAADLAPFKTYDFPSLSDGAPLADGTPAFDDRSLPVCVDNVTASTSYCESGTLGDDGPTNILWAAYAGSSPMDFSSGTVVNVNVGPAGALLGSYSFTVSTAPVDGVDLVEVEAPGSTAYIDLGAAAFFRYDVFLDPAHGVEGIAPHAGDAG